ncbi:helix-turn-helix transcriptional regulator [Sphingobium yanoikuyae]|uniref:helix-turn-helix transcriptional regulator n=1 Tax=Sphingobium yanoikuyae TaxID=13690 RepID=UPI00241F6004|nr:helix-turn-helix transcriptional regulator [Sphingobium yanoikuyae]
MTRYNPPPELEKYRAAVESLTNRQRQCMSYVAQGLKSKRIGPKLGIQPGTVDKHIEKVRNILGDMDRFDAAQIVMAFEVAREAIVDNTQFLAPQTFGISSESETVSPVPADHEASAEPGRDGQFVEEQGSYSLERLATSVIDWLPLRSSRRPTNDLNQSKAVITAAALGTLALLLAGSALSLLTVLDSFARP